MPQPVKARVQTYRQKLRAAGLKPVQLWLPDPAAPGFAEECQRQSRLVAQDPHDLDDLDVFNEVADWGE